MIAQIEGKLVSLEEDKALVQVGAVCYEVLLAGYAVSALSGSVGTEVVLSTMEYLEGSPGGGNLIPRLVGFLSPGEKAFFRRFTSVKGMGIRKGLKALAMPIGRIADAIENGDEKFLASLPGIGKRMAQVAIAELRGKLGAYALGEPAEREGGRVQFAAYQTEALEILIAWGEKRNEAMELVQLACRRHPNIRTAEELVPLIYRIKQGIEV